MASALHYLITDMKTEENSKCGLKLLPFFLILKITIKGHYILQYLHFDSDMDLNIQIIIASIQCRNQFK